MNDLKQIENYYKVSNQIDWDKIIDDYTPYINTIINNMADSLSYEDKEEILLDTFFMLWKNQDNILYSLKAYIVGITKNLIKEKLRKRHITYNISDYEEILTDCENNIDMEERPEIIIIEKLFKTLKEIDFKIVNMFYYSSKSIKEIAKELNMSEFNVKTRLYRVRKKIKKELNIGREKWKKTMKILSKSLS